jgi:hypothetical protein
MVVGHRFRFAAFSRRVALIFMASLNGMRVIAELFFPFLGIAFTLLFSALAVGQSTQFDFALPPERDRLLFLQMLGFWKFEGRDAIAFESVGFMLVMLLGQVGRIRRARAQPLSYAADEIDEMELQLKIEDANAALRFERVRRKLSRVMARCRGGRFLIIVCHMTLCASVVLVMVQAFYRHRLAFQVLALFDMAMVFLLQDRRSVFEMFKFFTGGMLIV